MNFRYHQNILESQLLLSILNKLGPPGPPPREGLAWKEETHRWIRPETGEHHESSATDFKEGDTVQWKAKGGKVMEGKVVGFAPKSGKVIIQRGDGKPWAFDPSPFSKVGEVEEKEADELTTEEQIPLEQPGAPATVTVPPTPVEEPTPIVEEPGPVMIPNQFIQSLGLKPRWRERWGPKVAKIKAYNASIGHNVDIEENPDKYLDSIFGDFDYRTAATNVIKDLSVYMAIKSSNFNKVLKDGRFKSSIETGKGTFKTVGNERFQKMEKPIFGLSDDTPHEDFPKYGFLASNEGMDYENIVGWGYGDMFVKFKPEVKQQATFTNGDSYDGNHGAGSMAGVSSLIDIDPVAAVSPVLNLSGFDKDIKKSFTQEWINDPSDYKKMLKASNTSSTYLEAQIFGNLPLDMIESVEVGSIKTQTQLQKTFKKMGLNIEVKGAQFDERLKNLVNWDYDKSHSVNDEDIDQLGDQYIDSLVKNNGGYVNGVWLAIGNDPTPEIKLQLEDIQATFKYRREDMLEALDVLAQRESTPYTNYDRWRTQYAEIRDILETSQEPIKEVNKFMTDNPVESKILSGTTFGVLDSVARDKRFARVPMDDKRRMAKNIYRIKAMGKDSGLKKDAYNDFRPAQVGWVKDIANKALLERYPK